MTANDAEGYDEAKQILNAKSCWKAANVPERYRSRIGNRAPAFRQWWVIADAWSEKPPTGVTILAGRNRTGKSHLAVHAIREYCRRGQPCKYRSATQMIHDFLDAQHHGALVQAFMAVTLPALLVIDDMHTVPMTDATRQRLIEVIDGRHRERRATVLVTNHSSGHALLNELGPQIAHRVGPDGGGVIECDWEPLPVCA